MANVTKPGFGWGWLAAVAVLCAAVFAVGHVFSDALSSRVVEVSDAKPLGDAGPLSEEARYKIPVSISQPKRGPADALVDRP